MQASRKLQVALDNYMNARIARNVDPKEQITTDCDRQSYCVRLSALSRHGHEDLLPLNLKRGGCSLWCLTGDVLEKPFVARVKKKGGKKDKETPRRAVPLQDEAAVFVTPQPCVYKL